MVSVKCHRHCRQTDNNNTNHFTAICPRLPGWARTRNKHSLTHTYPDHQSSFIGFLHLLRSIASSLFNLRARQSFSKISVKVLFSLPLGLEPFNSYSIHFFTQTKSIIIIESCLSVCVLSPPKRLDVRRWNLARRRVTMLSYTWAGSNVNRGMEHSSRNWASCT